jgi:hypothetical protein
VLPGLYEVVVAPGAPITRLDTMIQLLFV